MGKTYTIYTDGSCVGGNPGFGGWAIWIDGETDCGSAYPVTNNQMELFAILMAVKALPVGSHAKLHTDSRMAIGWIVRNWRIIDKPHLEEIRTKIRDVAMYNRIRVEFQKVKGHSTNELNNLVDQLARREAVLLRPHHGR